MTDWTPAPDQRCCGTCRHLRTEDEALVCRASALTRYVLSRWWGAACVEWERCSRCFGDGFPECRCRTEEAA